MSTATLTSLRDYLYGVLTPANMLWLSTELAEYAKRTEKELLRPFTMEDIDDMLDEAEAAFEAGDYLTNEDVFHHNRISVAV